MTMSATLRPACSRRSIPPMAPSSPASTAGTGRSSSRSSWSRSTPTSPDELEVHLVCDNYSTHKSPSILTWLEAHPRFHMHFTPTYSSWINQVERFFAYVTADLLQRSDHRSVQPELALFSAHSGRGRRGSVGSRRGRVARL